MPHCVEDEKIAGSQSGLVVREAAAGEEDEVGRLQGLQAIAQGLDCTCKSTHSGLRDGMNAKQQLTVAGEAGWDCWPERGHQSQGFLVLRIAQRDDNSKRLQFACKPPE